MKTILQIATNVQVKVERVYIRMEDPDMPYALGVLVPSIAVESADKIWNVITHVLENPSVMFKRVVVKDIQVFLERDPILSSIDRIVQ